MWTGWTIHINDVTVYVLGKRLQRAEHNFDKLISMGDKKIKVRDISEV